MESVHAGGCSATLASTNINLQGAEVIPSKQIGYVLRILGQNPTEDDIVEMVMKVRLSKQAGAYLMHCGSG